MNVIDLLALTPYDEGKLRWSRVWWNSPYDHFLACTRARKAAIR